MERIILAVLISLSFFSSNLFAKGAKKASASSAKSSGGAAAGSRERVISREGRSKAGSKTKIDFDDTDIGGAAKTPYGTMLSNTKSNKNYDLVPIRTDWRSEMLQSAASLDAGRNR
jgi:hypothetical protein